MNSEEEFDTYVEEMLTRSIYSRKVLRYFQNPFDFYSEEKFRRRYRFSKGIVNFVLLPVIAENLNKFTRRGLPVPPIQQLLVALRFYSSGSFQMVTGDLIKVSQPTVSRIVKKVSRLFCLRLTNYIKFPSNLQSTKEKFYSLASFSGVVGAVDGTRVSIQNTGGANAEIFRNRKRHFSLNIQIVCGPDLEIYNIVADRPGSVHDNRIFDLLSLKTKLEEGAIDGILLGDSGYGCQKYLLTHVGRPETISEQRYNKAHIKTRNVVERAIGVWKRIFRCLTKKMALNLTTKSHVIVATAVLYNICRAHGAVDVEEDLTVRASENTRNSIQSSREALLFRRTFVARNF